MSGWRMFIGGALVALVLVLAVLVWVDRATPVTIVIEAMPTEEMRVSVAGAVASPGVVVVPPDARLADVASAAGGFTDATDYSGLNLAGRVGDGEQIVIPSRATIGVTATPEVLETSRDEAAPLDINLATPEELDELPGIGEVLASRIIEFREEQGPFTTVDDLVQIDGISERMVDDLRPLITVDHGD